MSDDSEQPPVPSVRERLRSVRMSDARIEQHHRDGTLRVDGEPVTDLDAPEPGTRIVIWGS